MLTIGPGSKALGLNEAVTAELLGASNLYTNPANLALERHSSLNATHTLWIGDMSHTNTGITLRKESHAFAFGFLGTQVNDIPLRESPGPANDSFNISSFALSGGYARKWGPVALGSAFHYLREEIYIDNASGYALNIGLSLQLFEDRLLLGTSLLNIGEMDKLRNESTQLPTMVRAGFNAQLFSLTSPKSTNLPFTLYLKNDLVLPINNSNLSTQDNKTGDIYTNIALELDIGGFVALRMGYKTGDTVRHWSGGAEISMGAVSANYALVPFETGFGTAHSIGLQYHF
jgi:hypothetical protein